MPNVLSRNCPTSKTCEGTRHKCGPSRFRNWLRGSYEQRMPKSFLMADTTNLTQTEADALIAMEKRRNDDTEWSYPDFGGHVTIPLVSIDRRESFL